MYRQIVIFITKLCIDPLHIMIVHKTVQTHAAAQSHVHLPLHGMRNLEIVVIIVSAV